jgi:hypothetical protein
LSSKQKKRKDERLLGGEGSCRLDRRYPDSGNDGRRRHRYAELGGPSAQLVSAFAFLLSLRASPSHTGTLQKEIPSKIELQESRKQYETKLFFVLFCCPPSPHLFYLFIAGFLFFLQFSGLPLF